MLPTLEGPFESEELLRDPYVLLVPADHELGGPERTSLAELGDLTLIGNRACRSTALAEGELVQRGVDASMSPSARTTTAPCRGSSARASALRSCRCSRSTGTTPA